MPRGRRMVRMCPRCAHLIPNDLQAGQFPGAISLATGKEICSPCGSHEAMLQSAGHKLPGRGTWPIATPWSWYVTTPMTFVRIGVLSVPKAANLHPVIKRMLNDDAKAAFRKLGVRLPRY